MNNDAQHWLSETFNHKSVQSVRNLALEIEKFLYDTEHLCEACDVDFYFESDVTEDFNSSNDSYVFKIRDNNTQMRHKEIKLKKTPTSSNLYSVTKQDVFQTSITIPKIPLLNIDTITPRLNLDTKTKTRTYDSVFKALKTTIFECFTRQDQKRLSNNIV